MAGRIRSIKPEIISDEKIAGLSHLQYRLFIGTLVLADDHGNLGANPEHIRGQVVWDSKETRGTVSMAITELIRVGLLVPYTVRGQSYLHVAGWSKHQRIDKPAKARIPGPTESDRQDFPELNTGVHPTLELTAGLNSEEPGPVEDPAGFPTDQGGGRSALDREMEGEEERERKAEIPRKRGRPRKASQEPLVPFPEGWEPNDLDTPQRRMMFEKFKSNHLSKGNVFADWSQAWVTWKLKENEFARPQTQADQSREVIRDLPLLSGSWGNE